MMILEAEGFQQWKDNPLTREFLQLCRDRQQALAMAWARGRNLTAEEQSQAVLLGQLAQVRFNATDDAPGIHEMFGLEPPAEVSDGKADE